jgi:hypothetical protein
MQMTGATVGITALATDGYGLHVESTSTAVTGDLITGNVITGATVPALMKLETGSTTYLKVWRRRWHLCACVRTGCPSHLACIPRVVFSLGGGCIDACVIALRHL